MVAVWVRPCLAGSAVRRLVHLHSLSSSCPAPPWPWLRWNAGDGPIAMTAATPYPPISILGTKVCWRYLASISWHGPILPCGPSRPILVHWHKGYCCSQRELPLASIPFIYISPWAPHEVVSFHLIILSAIHQAMRLHPTPIFFTSTTTLT